MPALSPPNVITGFVGGAVTVLVTMDGAAALTATDPLSGNGSQLMTACTSGHQWRGSLQGKDAGEKRERNPNLQFLCEPQ